MDTMDLMDAIDAGREALREGLVEPTLLVLDARGWRWCKFRALSGHPAPGNAGRGFSHPAGDALARLRESKGATPGVMLEASAADMVRVMRGIADGLMIERYEIEIAQRTERQDQAQVGGYDAAGELIRGGNVEGAPILEASLLIEGARNWQEYPDAGQAINRDKVEGYAAWQYVRAWRYPDMPEGAVWAMRDAGQAHARREGEIERREWARVEFWAPGPGSEGDAALARRARMEAAAGRAAETWG